MLIGYCRVSKADGSQSTALQRDALIASGVDPEQIYEDRVSGVTTERPGLDSCLKALRGHAEGQVGAGDILVVWKLDRLGRSLKHLVQLMEDLDKRGIGLRSLTEGFDTTTPVGRLSFGVIASLAQFERDLIKERVSAGLTAARARGRLGGRPATRVAKLIAAAAAMTDPRASPRERAPGSAETTTEPQPGPTACGTTGRACCGSPATPRFRPLTTKPSGRSDPSRCSRKSPAASAARLERRTTRSCEPCWTPPASRAGTCWKHCGPHRTNSSSGSRCPEPPCGPERPNKNLNSYDRKDKTNTMTSCSFSI